MRYLNALVVKFIISTIIFLSLVLNNFAFGQLINLVKLLLIIHFLEMQMIVAETNMMVNKYLFLLIGLEIPILLIFLMDLEIGFILVLIHYMKIIYYVSDPFKLVFGQNQNLVQQYPYLLLVEWSLAGVVETVLSLGWVPIFNLIASASGKNSDGNWHQ